MNKCEELLTFFTDHFFKAALLGKNISPAALAPANISDRARNPRAATAIMALWNLKYIIMSASLHFSNKKYGVVFGFNQLKSTVMHFIHSSSVYST